MNFWLASSRGLFLVKQIEHTFVNANQNNPTQRQKKKRIVVLSGEHRQVIEWSEITHDRVRLHGGATAADLSAEPDSPPTSGATAAQDVPLCPPCWDTPGQRSDAGTGRGGAGPGTMLCRAEGCHVGACGLVGCLW